MPCCWWHRPIPHTAQFVVEAGRNASEGQCEVLRLAVPAGQAEPDVEPLPASQQSGMLGFLRRPLFGIAAHGNHFVLWSFHAAVRLGGDFKLAVARDDRSHDGLPVLQANVQRLIGLDFLNGGPLHRHLTGKFSLDDQGLSSDFSIGPLRRSPFFRTTWSANRLAGQRLKKRSNTAFSLNKTSSRKRSRSKAAFPWDGGDSRR